MESLLFLATIIAIIITAYLDDKDEKKRSKKKRSRKKLWLSLIIALH